MIIVRWKQLIINVLIPLIIGGISSLLTMNSMQVYKELNMPKLAPPGWLFPIVWSILFILMGIASYIVYESNSKYKKPAFIAYALQLLFNFIWTIVFFNFHMYWLSVIIIFILIILIILNIYYFSKVDKKAAILLLPYLIWVIFASYLNVQIALLN